MKDFVRYYAACLLVFAGMLCGCQRVDDNGNAVKTTPPTTTVDAGYILSVFTDDATGCQYLGLYGHGLTARMASDGKGGTYQMGCKT